MMFHYYGSVVVDPVPKSVTIVIDCAVICSTGSITCPLHDYAFGIKVLIMSCAVYRLGQFIPSDQHQHVIMAINQTI